MELTGYPIWKIYYSGLEMPKSITYLNEVQNFVAEHDIQSIVFYVTVMLTTPGEGGVERDFNEREMTKEELLSLTQRWVEETMEEAAQTAQKHFGLVDKSS
jgi:hypothetical protein